MQRETVAQNLQCRAPFGARTTAERQANSRRDVLGCSRKEKNGSTTSKTKTVTTHAEPRFLTRRNNASEPSPASANRVRKKLARRPLTPKALSGTWHPSCCPRRRGRPCRENAAALAFRQRFSPSSQLQPRPQPFCRRVFRRNGRFRTGEPTDPNPPAANHSPGAGFFVNAVAR